jgi:hypothetical protein
MDSAAGVSDPKQRLMALLSLHCSLVGAELDWDPPANSTVRAYLPDGQQRVTDGILRAVPTGGIVTRAYWLNDGRLLMTSPCFDELHVRNIISSDAQEIITYIESILDVER